MLGGMPGQVNERLTGPQADGWRRIPITLKILPLGF